MLTAWRSSSSPLPKNTASRPVPLHGHAPPSQRVVNSWILPKLINFQLEGAFCSIKSGSELPPPCLSPCAAGLGLRRDSRDRTGQRAAGREESFPGRSQPHTHCQRQLLLSPACSQGRSQPSEPTAPKWRTSPHQNLTAFHSTAAPHRGLREP